MVWKLKRDLFPLGIIVLVCVLSIIFYAGLPESVPSHFNAEGAPDRFLPKLEFMIIIVGAILGMYLLLTFLPFIDPLWKKIQSKYHILLIFRDVALVLLLYLYVLNIVAAKEGHLRVDLLGVGLGFLFVLLGNYLPKLPRNWFFGIRVPWTLSSEIVWKKTHIVGGWLFVTAGLVMAILSLLKVNPPVVFLITLVPTVVIVGFLYPFLLFRRLQKEGKLDSAETPL
jgi:uncharacterized membrane protein